MCTYCEHEGYEIFEEIEDAGQSGASLERPGLDAVGDVVASCGVTVVLAQDGDRFAREPAYHYLLNREFEEYGTKIRALNDRGDENPEGELADGILDQPAKYERAKIAERSRRGKLRKAREGKVVAAQWPNYGSRYNATRDGYEVDEEAMSVVRRIFFILGTEGRTIHAVKRTLESESVRAPNGGEWWSKAFLRDCILDDVYKPHTYEEVKRLVTREVASYAAMLPDALDGLTAEERNRIYRMLRLKVLAGEDKSIEISGILGNNPDFKSRESDISTLRPSKRIG